MSKQSPESYDPRFVRLRQLGQTEREMTAALSDTRAEIAALVVDLTPPHAPAQQVEVVVRASGYSRILVDALRNKKHSWYR